MKTQWKLIFAALLLQSVWCDQSYRNYKAYDVTPTDKNIEELLSWRDEDGIDFWKSGGAGRMSRVAVAPYLQKPFEDFLAENQIDFVIKIEDVGDLEEEFEADRVRRLAMKKKKSVLNPMSTPDFNVYWTSEEIDTYSKQLAANYPHLVQREVIAITFEGREVFAMKVSSGGFGRKPIIFMDGGMHAREWVSHASVVYLLHRLIEDPATSAELLQNVDWIIIPNLNPDGYTWSYTQSRMWRQNRNEINSTCMGVDLNRNFRFSWTAPRFGSCLLITFSGLTPLSEVESTALNNYMTRYRTNVKMYISVHSFGDMVLYPWGFSGSPGWISNWQYHHQVGQLWADAIRQATGKNYVVGNIADILGNAFGASDDHMAGEQGVELVYTLELTGGGSTGFDFPESQIGALVRETFWGYRAFGLFIGNTYN